MTMCSNICIYSYLPGSLPPNLTPDIVRSRKGSGSLNCVGGQVTGSSPVLGEGEDQTCSNILALLEPSAQYLNTDSPGNIAP